MLRHTQRLQLLLRRRLRQQLRRCRHAFALQCLRQCLRIRWRRAQALHERRNRIAGRSTRRRRRHLGLQNQLSHRRLRIVLGLVDDFIQGRRVNSSFHGAGFELLERG